MKLFRTAAVFASGALFATAIATVTAQPWIAGAAPGDDDTTYIPIAPCRVIDTRPGVDNVGPRATQATLREPKRST